jgi:hypothetical protein
MNTDNTDQPGGFKDRQIPHVRRFRAISAMPAIAGTGRLSAETVINAPLCSMSIKKAWTMFRPG